MDILHTHQNTGSLPFPSKPSGESDLKRGKPQEKDIVPLDSSEVQCGPKRINRPGDKSSKMMDREVRPVPFYDKITCFFPFNQSAPIRLVTRRPGNSCHDLHFMPPCTEIGSQLIHQNRSAPVLRKIIHGMDIDSHGFCDPIRLFFSPIRKHRLQQE